LLALFLLGFLRALCTFVVFVCLIRVVLSVLRLAVV
jgi:hypothetical protein